MVSEIAAFPHKQEKREIVTMGIESVTPGDYPGMTLRDYFAAMAMQSLMVRSWDDFEVWASSAYKMADAMLVERAK